MSEFNNGDVATLVAVDGLLAWPEYINQDVVIVGPLMERNVWADRQRTESVAALCYQIRTADGRILCAYPENLAKKPPDDATPNAIASWNDEGCPWWPESVARGTR